MLVRKDFKAYKVQPVSLALRDFKGHKAFKVQPDLLVHKD